MLPISSSSSQITLLKQDLDAHEKKVRKILEDAMFSLQLSLREIPDNPNWYGRNQAPYERRILDVLEKRFEAVLEEGAPLDKEQTIIQDQIARISTLIGRLENLSPPRASCPIL